MFEPMIKDSDLKPSEAGRWIQTDLMGNVFLMQGEKTVDWCTNETMPPKSRRPLGPGWTRG